MLQTAEVEMAWARGLVISAPTHNATTVCTCTQACFKFCCENSLKLNEAGLTAVALSISVKYFTVTG